LQQVDGDEVDARNEGSLRMRMMRMSLIRKLFMGLLELESLNYMQTTKTKNSLVEVQNDQVLEESKEEF